MLMKRIRLTTNPEAGKDYKSPSVEIIEISHEAGFAATAGPAAPTEQMTETAEEDPWA